MLLLGLIVALHGVSSRAMMPAASKPRYYRELSALHTFLNGNADTEWLNFGMWTKGPSMLYPAAAETLADAVSSAAAVQEGDIVLEAGGGRGDNVSALCAATRCPRCWASIIRTRRPLLHSDG
eukprot:TRINITY_DN51385_c0_g1_i1.p1 TRINITY_DN51385_c0_g1~~TRINITY_DN51385_c0_g1_i1.p1  ORF type:complete len:123 (-),score=14.21 TRINITY_DN51385_c0_g1_i1:167-535(-)